MRDARPLVMEFTDRRWAATFGLSKERCKWLHQRVGGPRKPLLWMLYFFKLYPTASAAAAILSVDESTFRSHVSQAVERCDDKLPSVRRSYIPCTPEN